MPDDADPIHSELERLLNDPDSPLLASRIWALADELAKSASRVTE